MKTKSHSRHLNHVLRIGALILAVSVAPLANAVTLWTGPNTNFTQFAPAAADLLISNAVSLTRGPSQWLYNGVTEGGPVTASPADTLWAFGTISNYAALSYQTFASYRNGDLADVILNKPMVLQLVNEQVYISIEFTAWGTQGAGGFAYTRSTAPAASPTPTVSLTNPASGAVFSAPANVKLAANATVSSGTVTNVAFFTNAVLLRSVTNAPFSITASNLAAGSYALTAVATAGGVSATSAVVSVSVVTPVATTLSNPAVSNGVFSFKYTANPGLTYVVQNSSNLTTWLSLVTNVAASSPVLFTNGIVAGASFYRVGRLPNP